MVDRKPPAPGRTPGPAPDEKADVSRIMRAISAVIAVAVMAVVVTSVNVEKPGVAVLLGVGVLGLGSSLLLTNAARRNRTKPRTVAECRKASIEPRSRDERRIFELVLEDARQPILGVSTQAEIRDEQLWEAPDGPDGHRYPIRRIFRHDVEVTTGTKGDDLDSWGWTYAMDRMDDGTWHIADRRAWRV